MLSSDSMRQVYNSTQQQQLLQLQLMDLGGPALLNLLDRKAGSSRTPAEKAVWAWLEKRNRAASTKTCPLRNCSWDRGPEEGTSDAASSDSSDDLALSEEEEELSEAAESRRSARGNEAESTYLHQNPIPSSAGVHQSTCLENTSRHCETR